MRDSAYRLLLGHVVTAWLGVLLVPILPVAGLSIAIVFSWTASAASAWGFFRTHKGKWLLAFGLTFPVAAAFMAYVVWLLISPTSCYQHLQRWVF